MKLSLTWLRDYADLPDDTDAIVAALAELGLPVEELITTGPVPGVITARVVRTDRHPDAAKVQRVWIDAGDGVERHVWCGAFNFAAGDVVPLATLGTAMPDGRVIAQRGILGIDSEGMLCSARELGLGDDHSGIMLLPADSALGVPYGDAVGLVTDTVVDIDITRNRPDAYGVVGVARDLAAYFGVPLRAPQSVLPELGDERVAPVTIVDGDRCGRFTTLVISGIEVGPSAPWMARRLRAVGQRPINNVVDVSNFVMLELNQPNHTYDLDTLGGGALRIRRAVDGERITTLDDVERVLTSEDLLICDGDDVPIGLAGIMGGAGSGISESTTTVALEIAWFEPHGIGAGVTRTGLRSDASTRFERGVDPYGMPRAAARVVELLAETSPNLVVHAGAVDARATSLPPEQRIVELRLAQVKRLLGIDLDADGVSGLLTPIGFATTGAGETLAVSIPTWRPDVTIEVDLIEEIAKHYGYGRIPTAVPLSPLHGHLTLAQQRRRLLRRTLVGLGLLEVLPNAFLSAVDVERAALGIDTTARPSQVLRITNPVVSGEDVLRPSLRPGLLAAVAYNASHRRPGVELFEIGHVYRPAGTQLPDEREWLGVVLAGREAPAAVEIWRAIAETMGVGARLDQSQVPPGLHATRSATLVAGRDPLGFVGEIDPEVLAAFDIDERVAVLEIDLTTVLAAEPKPARWKPTSRHPSSDLDIAFVLADDVPAEKLEKALRQAAGKLLVSIDLFDVYRGERLGAGRRSLAYRLRLQAPDRTLSDTDVATVLSAARTAAQKFGAELRS